MLRFRAFALMAALALSLLCGVARSEEFELQYTTDDHALEIYADHPVDKERCKSIADRVVKAYAYIASQEGWKNGAQLHAKPLQFRLVGNLKVLGYAQGPNLMVMKDEYLDDPLSEGTLSHELTHIQDLRQLQGAKLPSFMLEGRALTNGHSYRMSLGQEANSYDHQMARSAMRFNSANAEALLSNYRGQGWDNQAMGTVLVEFMRTRWKGGIADVHPRLSRMIEAMAGGVEFEPAFQKEFGATFLSLCQEFAHHLDETGGDPASRLQHTMWEGVTPSANGPSSEEDE